MQTADTAARQCGQAASQCAVDQAQRVTESRQAVLVRIGNIQIAQLPEALDFFTGDRIASHHKLPLGIVHGEHEIRLPHHPAGQISGTMLTNVDTRLPHQFKRELIGGSTFERT